MQPMLKQKRKQVPILGPLGAIIQTRNLGVQEYTVTEEGLLGTDDLSLRRLISAFPKDPISVIGHTGGNLGREVTIASPLEIDKRDIPPATPDEFTQVKINYVLGDKGEVIEEATLIAGGRVYSSGQVGNDRAPRIDLGAAPADSKVRVVIMVDEYDGGAANLVVSVNGSTNTIAWTPIAEGANRARLTLPSTTVSGAYLTPEIASQHRYFNLNIDFGIGGSPSASILAAVKRV